MSINYENDYNDYNDYNDIYSINCESLKVIIKQMETSICKIKNNTKIGTGFFCKIPSLNNKCLQTVLITNNHLINVHDIFKEKKINILYKKKNIQINIDDKRNVYSDGINDITIIQILKADSLDVSFLEIDDKIFENANDKKYQNLKIYTIGYSDINLKEPYCSFGIITNKSKNHFFHLCYSKDICSSGSPIFNLKNYKVIGIHGPNKSIDDKSTTKINIGIFIKEPIEDYNKNFMKDLNEEFNQDKTVIYINEKNEKKINDIYTKNILKKNKSLYNNKYENNQKTYEIISKYNINNDTYLICRKCKKVPLLQFPNSKTVIIICNNCNYEDKFMI